MVYVTVYAKTAHNYVKKNFGVSNRSYKYNSTFVVNLERKALLRYGYFCTRTYCVTKTAIFVRCGSLRSGVAARTNALAISKVSIKELSRHYKNLLWYRVSLVLHLRVSHSIRWLYTHDRDYRHGRPQSAVTATTTVIRPLELLAGL